MRCTGIKNDTLDFGDLGERGMARDKRLHTRRTQDGAVRTTQD